MNHPQPADGPQRLEQEGVELNTLDHQGRFKGRAVEEEQGGPSVTRMEPPVQSQQSTQSGFGPYAGEETQHRNSGPQSQEVVVDGP